MQRDFSRKHCMHIEITLIREVRVNQNSGVGDFTSRLKDANMLSGAERTAELFIFSSVTTSFLLLNIKKTEETKRDNIHT